MWQARVHTKKMVKNPSRQQKLFFWAPEMPEEQFLNILAWGTDFVLENDNLWPLRSTHISVYKEIYM